MVAATPGTRRPVRGKFAAQRAQPFWDLVGLLDAPDGGGFGRCVDLGCGSGELTLAVTERLGIHEMVGIDTSPAMLAGRATWSARPTTACASSRGDIAQWTARGDHDLVLANASPAVGPRPRRGARPVVGGAAPRAASSPCRCRPTPIIRRTVVATRSPPPSRSVSAMGGMPPVDPVAANVLDPAQYAIRARPARRRRPARAAAGVSASPAVVGERRRVGEGHDAHPVRQGARPTSCTPGSSTTTASACSTPSVTASRTSTPSSAS